MPAPAKKRWGKAKVRTKKIDNAVIWKDTTHDRLMNEVPKFGLISISTVSERLGITGSLAKDGIRELEEKGVIRKIRKHSNQWIYSKVEAE